MIEPKILPPPADRYPVRRALLSVSDKSGVAVIGRRLAALGIELISTGGTARTLREAGLTVLDVTEVTGSPEIMDGRVKTLHPAIHAGLLARRNDPDDLAELDRVDAAPIDLVVVNLYPFAEAAAKADVTDAQVIENIDIGGPAMIRAAAKNYFFTGVITSPEIYDEVASELEQHGCTLSMATRRRLAARAFDHTAGYDTQIAGYFARKSEQQTEQLPDRFNLSLPKAQDLRYGENPHQPAAFYGNPKRFFEQLHGKDLSYNNLLDLSGALSLIDEFLEDDPTAAILKHTNPCGVGTADSLAAAYRKAFQTDRQSPFGGIIAVNRPLDMETAEAVDEIFTEIIIAPAFDERVLPFLQEKKNRRVIRSLSPARDDEDWSVRSVLSGLLVQNRDRATGGIVDLQNACTVVSRRSPTNDEWRDLLFAWRVCKHVKSNAIVYARGGATLGIGAGQMSRIDASEIAVQKGRKSGLGFDGSVVASDAFFPFADGLIAAAEVGARAAVQPGGSIRDEEVIQAADKYEMTMVFTGRRHFLH